MKKFIFYSSLFALVGCAAALVPASNDPKVKIAQATDLFRKQGRAEGAITVFSQAVALAQKQNDKRSEATAEFYIGEIYKQPGPGWQKLQNPQEALPHYKRAIAIYSELHFFKNAAMLCWMEGGAYELLKDKKSQCKTLSEAQRFYDKPGADAKETMPEMFAGSRMLTAIEDAQTRNECIKH